MAIRNVNGRNVYVLEPREPTGKTTSGKNWATLYSDLRWQVWEEVQKNQALMLKTELQVAEYERKKQADLRKSIDNLQDLKDDLLKGDSPNSVLNSYIRLQELIERQSRPPKVSGETVTKRQVIVKDEYGAPITDPATGLPKTMELETIKGPPEGAVAPTTRGVPSGLRKLEAELAGQLGLTGEKAPPPVEGEAPAEGEKIDTSGAVLDIDAEIDKLEQELSQFSDRQFDFDLGRRSREAFASQVGVMGQGGGAFGLAPRPRRTIPFVQEDLAQERIDRFLKDRNRMIADYEQQKIDELDKEITKLDQLKKARQDVALLLEGDPEDIRNQALLGGLDDEIARQDRTIRIATADLGKAGEQADRIIRQRIQGDERFTPRAPGELLRKDIRRDYVDIPAAALAGQRLREAEQALQPLEEPVPSFESFPMEAGRAESGIGQEPITAVPAAPVTPAPATTPAVAPEDEIVFKTSEVTQVEPEPVLEKGQASLGGGYVFDGQSGIIFGPTGFPVFATFPQQVPAGQEEPKVVSELALRGIAQRIRESGGDISAVSGYQSKEAKPEDFELEEEEFPMEPAGPPQGSTRQRKDKYKFEVVSEGTKLAAQPKKLNRLAKTEAEPENRPQHLVIVDKLYETNKGKGDNFKMTYDEISRAFADKPDERKEAHTYLVAKDILESNIDEPLA